MHYLTGPSIITLQNQEVDTCIAPLIRLMVHATHGNGMAFAGVLLGNCSDKEQRMQLADHLPRLFRAIGSGAKMPGALGPREAMPSRAGSSRVASTRIISSESSAARAGLGLAISACRALSCTFSNCGDVTIDPDVVDANTVMLALRSLHEMIRNGNKAALSAGLGPMMRLGFRDEDENAAM